MTDTAGNPSAAKAGVAAKGRSGAGIGVIESAAWYKAQYQRLMKVSLTLVAINAALALVTVLSFTVLRPAPQYFAATQDLRLAPMVALDQPTMHDAGVTEWVNQTVIDALSFGFTDWRETLQRVRPNFDPQAFDGLVLALKGSGLLEKVTKQRLNLAPVTTRNPVVANKGVIGGQFAWRITLEMSVSFEGSGGTLGKQTFEVTAIAQRADTRVYPKGIVIKQLVLK